MLTHQIAFYIHQERQREIERHIALRAMEANRLKNRSLRRRLGGALIRLGSALAPEAPVALASRR